MSTPSLHQLKLTMPDDLYRDPSQAGKCSCAESPLAIDQLETIFFGWMRSDTEA